MIWPDKINFWPDIVCWPTASPGLNNAFSEYSVLEASPVEGHTLPQKKLRKGEQGKARKKTKKKQTKQTPKSLNW